MPGEFGGPSPEEVGVNTTEKRLPDLYKIRPTPEGKFKVNLPMGWIIGKETGEDVEYVGPGGEGGKAFPVGEETAEFSTVNEAEEAVRAAKEIGLEYQKEHEKKLE